MEEKKCPKCKRIMTWDDVLVEWRCTCGNVVKPGEKKKKHKC